jgi:hypothetical protein
LGNKGRPSVNKRRKEEARRQRRQVKAERMAARVHEKKEGGGLDISDIVPGPQPLPEELRDLADTDDREEEQED